ncbi:Type 1 glutamine amidotransferase-like domain-containing protein [Pseudocolwellia sp. HL-MZ19]|uniref:Type 1 glutamine amidotransferase-like domain-containing protein n=1 Tax=unclassified Pseudocolwellia TaxID=2848178 RepID=UPI003CEE0E9B
MKNIFLTSSFADVVNLFKEYKNEDLQGKTITFIPTASIHEEIIFYVEAGKKALESIGFIVDVLEISTASHEEILNKLKHNEFIYVGGGNTFFLLQELKRTKADKLIIDQINLGKTYIGESAGSVILSPNIEYISEMDNPKIAKKLASYDALGVIDFYPLPHYTNFPFKELAEKVFEKFSDKINMCTFSNDQAIIINDSNVKIVSKA